MQEKLEKDMQPRQDNEPEDDSDALGKANG